ncbi:hypothetical protein [Burkholderia sp. IMCC1007]|uniref:hypothetical protein n=1 Tax=Burkholderia sp. IMCC1007 TaxID=3004104 RepID=UPI0022B3F06D|nr:hypothetical protein [Burkholderia sp. IMCC1007]
MASVEKSVSRVPSLSSPAVRLIVRTGIGGCICALLLAADAPLNIFSPFFSYLLKTYDRPAAHLSLLVLIIAVAISPLCHRVSAVATACGRHPWRLAALTAVTFAFGARFIYHAHPLSTDEYTVWFQGRVFASGALTGQFPPDWLNRLVYPPFQNHLLVVSRTTGHVASAYWPGFALLLAPFNWIGADWLCNPVLSALTLVAIARTCQLAFPDEDAVAGWAMLFTLASPVFAASGISYFAMTGLLLANLAFVWGFLQPTPRQLFFSGVMGSIALTFHNPLPHVLFAFPWLVWFLFQRPSWRQMLTLIAGYAPLTLLLGIGWVLFKAHIATDIANHAARPPSQGVLDWIASAFTLPGLGILFVRLAGTVKLWIWAMPGLLILAGMGYARRRENIAVQLLVASAVLTYFGYFFVPFDQGNGWGYRYFHPAWSVLPILAGAAVAGSLPHGNDTTPAALRNQAGALIVCSLMILVPWQMNSIEHHIGTQLARIPEVPADKRSIVFLSLERSKFLIDLIQNDPYLRNRSIRMISSGEHQDAEFLRNAHIDAVPLPATEFGQAWLIR